MKENQNGFTLTELLVTIAILGIIMVLALPSVKNIQANNSKKKYETYQDTLISAGKLYVTNHSEDMFGYSMSGCYDVSYDQLVKKNLIKDIRVSDDTCATEYTKIRVRKSGDIYNYQAYVECKNKDGATVYKNPKTDPGATPTTDICDGVHADEEPPTITITPDGQPWTQGKNLSVTVTIHDDYGLTASQKIRYAWKKADGTTSAYKTISFKNAMNTIEVSRKVKLPDDLNGVYTLIVSPVVDGIYLSDLNGNMTMVNKESKEFKFDNTKPTCSFSGENTTWTKNKVTVSLNCSDPNLPDGSSGSGCAADYQKIDFSYTSGTHKIETTAGTIKDNAGNEIYCSQDSNFYYDKQAPTQPTTGAIGAVSGSSTTGKIQTAASGSDDHGGSGVKEYRYLVTNTSTKPTDKTKFTTSLNFTRSCGTTYYAWAIAVDNVGNMSSVKSLGNTSDGANDYSDWGTCSKKCGGGTQTRTNTCKLVTTSLSQSCNTQTCCSSTTKSCGDYGSCSKKCGTGTKKRTCKDVSSYDSSVVCKSDYTESANCNTTDCCSSTTTATCGDYGSCSKKCGTGTKTRTCTTVSSIDSSVSCSSTTQSASCNTTPCTPTIKCSKSGTDNVFETTNSVPGHWGYIKIGSYTTKTWSSGMKKDNYETGYGDIQKNSDYKWHLNRATYVKSTGKTRSNTGYLSSSCTA